MPIRKIKGRKQLSLARVALFGKYNINSMIDKSRRGGRSRCVKAKLKREG
jgi:hypothetical protein